MEALFPPPAVIYAGYGLTESAPVATSARDKSTVRFVD
jgi:acyl-CoA synthetase (AMP-forming)/AMP-acid ligase II